jgi:hypothetical protein
MDQRTDKKGSKGRICSKGVRRVEIEEDNRAIKKGGMNGTKGKLS